ncbi:TetR family transcriptional regulator [Kitasatospora sp. NPDC050543]|uniref:TetR/AcrR family transcriptional regulator n=1 Tax=Kitasatospora sp. NPDC050543 TaxID=3364054 RepID=UPI0037B34188
MAGDSRATRARLLDAAFAEFAEHGLAGARVDRIAAAAGANKRLIYVYFGNKEQLFDHVVERCLAEGSEVVPFDVTDLPGYAGALFDHLVARPDLMRLVAWKQLERPGATDSEAASYRTKVEALASAQAAGRVEPGIAPADILALTLALAQAWFTAAGGTGALRGADARQGADGPQSEAFTAHRAAVIEAVRRMTSTAAPAG